MGPPLHRCGGFDEIKGAPDFGRLIHTDVGVSRGCADRGVSKQRLDEPDIGSSLVEMGGEGMTKAMKGNALFDARFCHGLVENGSDRRTADGPSGVLPGEQIDPGRTNGLVVFAQETEQSFAQHHITIFAALSLSNVNDHAGTVDITTTMECACFGNPHSGGIGGGDDGPVLDGFNASQDIEDLLEAQYIGQRLMSPWIVEVLNSLWSQKGV